MALVALEFASSDGTEGIALSYGSNVDQNNFVPAWNDKIMHSIVIGLLRWLQ
jgi:hypothetical protein